MSILTGICYSAKLEFLQGIHNLSTDIVKAALYASSAQLDPTITAYTATGEVTDPNWPAGGVQLVTAAGYPQLDPTGKYGVWTFNSQTVNGPCTMTFRSVLLYNASKANRALCVIDKGVDIVITAGPVYIYTNPGAPYNITVQ